MLFDISVGPSGYFAALSRLLDQIEITTQEGEALPIDQGIGFLIESITSLKDRGGKVLLIGNGGSAAIVSHMQSDLCKAVGVRAMVFNETPLLTALANDHGYQAVFHQPMALWVDRSDLLIAMSSAGESENIVTAAKLARTMGAHVITLTGFTPTNRLRQVGDLNLYVPASQYGHVEMAHSVIAHCITDIAVLRTRAAV